MKGCLVIIPARNEEVNIGHVLSGLKEIRDCCDILVVSDGSTDRTDQIAKEAGVEVITLPFNLGYGGALQTGFKYAVAKGYEYVVQFDGDGQHDPADVLPIIDLLGKNRADIIIGSRFLKPQKARVGFMKKTAIAVFRLLIKMSTGVNITDPSSGLQGLNGKVFTYYSIMGNFPPDFPDADILIQMLLSGYRVCEVPANIRERKNGTSMHAGLRPVFYFVKMLISILVVLLRPKTVWGNK